MFNSRHPGPRRVWKGRSEQQLLPPLPAAPVAPVAPLVSSKKLVWEQHFISFFHIYNLVRHDEISTPGHPTLTHPTPKGDKQASAEQPSMNISRAPPTNACRAPDAYWGLKLLKHYQRFLACVLAGDRVSPAAPRFRHQLPSIQSKTKQC